MCGIAGWVDYTEDLSHERDILARMTRSMAARGPDDENLWFSRHAALGHRRLAVIDIEGGIQPMVSDGNVALTYSGEIYNFQELRRDLMAAGRQFRTNSDTEVVLQAYLEWGAEFVKRLNGMYAFGIWDDRVQELLLVRDRLGVKPLYYYPLPNGVLFGSEPKAILANSLAKRIVTPRGMCSIITQVSPPGITPFHGLYEVPPGHYLRLSSKGSSLVNYWELEARDHRDDLKATVATVRELLEDIVMRQRVADVPQCMLLSGGLDSSALVALAQQKLEDGDVVQTFAVDFRTNSEYLAGNALELHNEVDHPFAEEMAQHVGSRHETLLLETDRLLDPEVRRAALLAQDLPLQAGDMDISQRLLFEEISRRSTVAISGEAADEVFGGYPWLHDDVMLQMPLFPWMAVALPETMDMPAIIPEETFQRIGLYDYVLGEYADSLAAVPHCENEDAKERQMRDAMHQHLTRFLPNLLDRKDRMSMAVGLEVRVPFCDHRLVEYVYSAPWAMKVADGREKYLLREAVRDLLPEAVYQRRKSAYPITHDLRYDEFLSKELNAVLDNSNEAIRSLIDIEQVKVALASFGNEKTVSFGRRVQVEGALRFHMWMTEYGVELSDDA